MSRPIPTVEILDPKGSGERRVINAADFDPGHHTRWEGRDTRTRRRARRARTDSGDEDASASDSDSG